MLLRVKVVGVPKLGMMPGLLGVAGLVKFGCLPLAASRLVKVFRYCVVVFCSGRRNRKIRLLGVSRVSDGEICFSWHDTSPLRMDKYRKSTSPHNSIHLLAPLYREVICSSVQ